MVGGIGNIAVDRVVRRQHRAGIAAEQVGIGVDIGGRPALVNAVDAALGRLHIAGADQPFERPVALRCDTRFDSADQRLGLAQRIGGVRALGHAGDIGIGVGEDGRVVLLGDRSQHRQRRCIANFLVQPQAVHPVIGLLRLRPGRVADIGIVEVEIGLVLQLAVLIARQEGDLGRLAQMRDDRSAQPARAIVIGAVHARARIVEIARIIALERDQPHRQLVPHQRHVDHRLGGVVEIARRILGRADEAGRGRVDLRRVGDIGDIVDQPAQRRGTEQRALRAAQHLDPLQVERIDVGNADREARLHQRHFVQIIADRGLALFMIGGGGDAADHHFGNAGLIIVEDDAGQPGDIVRQAVGVHFLELFARDRADRQGDLANILVALAGGDDDRAIVLAGRLGQRRGGEQGGGRQRGEADRLDGHNGLHVISPSVAGAAVFGRRPVISLHAWNRSVPLTMVRSTLVSPMLAGSMANRSASITTKSASIPGAIRPMRSSWKPA